VIGLRPEFEAALVKFEAALSKAGIKVKRTSGYRSWHEQDALYARGRTAPGPIITNARGGQSWHNFGLAADYVFVVKGRVTWDGPWDRFGGIAVECGLEWGGNFEAFKDRPHVQMTGGKSIREMHN